MVGKLWMSAFQPTWNHFNWTSTTQVMIIWRGHGRWLWCAAFEVTFASNVGENASSGGSNVLSTPYYSTLLESPGCLLSNAVGSTSIGALQLELYSVEGAEVSWPHCRLPPCSFMHIAGQFSPSILVSTMQCHICLESSWFLLSNASWITSFGAL